jgi:hypothetical protein
MTKASLDSREDLMISGKNFCDAIDYSNTRLTLTNSDGYLKSQWQFIDRKEAASNYDVEASLSTFLIVDSNRSFHTIAPIVLDNDTQQLFGDLSRSFNVFPDEIQKI